MSDDKYHRQVVAHYQLLQDSQLELWRILQRLCPGYWTIEIQIVPVKEYRGVANPELGYRVCVTNGDDNVTCESASLGAATAKVIAALIEGAVFPLGGNGGVYIRSEDRPKDDLGESSI